MPKKLLSGWLSVLVFSMSAMAVPIVSNGTARAVIIQGNTGRACVMAVRELAKAIEECSGVSLKVMEVEKIACVEEGMTRLIVGNCAYAKIHGFGHEDLELEENIIAVKGRDVFFNGHNWDEPALRVYGAPQPPYDNIDPRRFSPAELFAVTEFMDRILGVRILWPGDGGRYYPRHTDISLPDDYVFRAQPKYLYRHPWYQSGGGDLAAVTEYLLMHRQCTRGPYSSQDQVYWFWNSYQKDHPEIFAKNPQGEPAYWQKPIFAKFCMSNPATADFLMERWREAGKPDTTPLLNPTDGKGDCCCAECRKLDPPEIQQVSADDIWLGKVQLTDRYIYFWNIMLARMQKENPKAQAFILGYDTYRVFPKGKKLIPGFFVNVVPDFNIFDVNETKIWEQWSHSGGKLFLRPNWQWVGVCLPHLPLKPLERYIRMAEANGMVGYEFDRIMENWALDGFISYAIIRLLNRSDLNMEDIKQEYASAFGKGAPEIVRFLNYWEQHTYKIFGSKDGEFTEKLGDGLLKQAIKEHKWIRNSPMYWMVDAWPILYSDEYLKPAEDILKTAESLIDKEDTKTLARLKFLSDGMRYVRQTNVCMNLWHKKPYGRSPEFLAERKKLLALREEFTRTRVVSWERMTEREFGLRYRTVPSKPDGGWPSRPKDYKNPRAVE